MNRLSLGLWGFQRRCQSSAATLPLTYLLRFLIGQSRLTNQFVSAPDRAPPYGQADGQGAAYLMDLYRHLHQRVHQPEGPLKLVVHTVDREILFASVRTDGPDPVRGREPRWGRDPPILYREKRNSLTFHFNFLAVELLVADPVET